VRREVGRDDADQERSQNRPAVIQRLSLTNLPGALSALAVEKGRDPILDLDLSQDQVRIRRPYKRFWFSLWCSRYSRIAFSRLETLVKDPRRIRFSVISANHRST
jgi:hypothetical protein